MSRLSRDPLYRRHRFPAEIISHALWLYFRFPLSLRMVEDMLAARGIIVTHQTIRDWAEKFGRHFANEIRRRSAGRLSDKWHLDEVVVSIAGKKCWLWRAVDQEGFVIDVLVQSRRNAKAAGRLMRKLLKTQGRAPRPTSFGHTMQQNDRSCRVLSIVRIGGSTIGRRIRTSRSDDGRGS